MAASAATSSSVATPPLAMTGMVVLAAAAARPARSGPPSVPSRPMSVITNAAAVGNHPSASSSRTPLPAVHPCTANSPSRWSRPTATGSTVAARSTSDGFGDRRRPHHDPRDAQPGERLDIADGAHSPAGLHPRGSGDGVGDRRDARPVHRIAGPGGVEVDDVDPRRARGGERRPPRRPDRRRTRSRRRSRPA